MINLWIFSVSLYSAIESWEGNTWNTWNTWNIYTRRELKFYLKIRLKFGLLVYFLNRRMQHNVLFNTVFFKSFNSTIVWLFVWRWFNYDYELWFDFEMHKQTSDKLKEQTELKSGETFKCWAQRHWTVWWGIWWFKSDPSDLWSQIFLW